MPDIHTLAVESRGLRRKKNRSLRADGRLPGVLYGHGVDNTPISMSTREFQRAFHRVGRTQLLDLTGIEGGDSRRVLVREVQYDPRSGNLQHVDFYQVNLKEKITADVPLTVVGEAPAVTNREGELQQMHQTLKVSCLPADIPEHIDVDVSGLEAIDDGIRVAQLTVPAEIEVLTDAEELVVKIAKIREVEEEPVVEPEEGAEGEAAEGAEGEAAPAEGGEAAAESSSEES
jgi:large subunit ribosomal protein L25